MIKNLSIRPYLIVFLLTCGKVGFAAAAPDAGRENPFPIVYPEGLSEQYVDSAIRDSNNYPKSFYAVKLLTSPGEIATQKMILLVGLAGVRSIGSQDSCARGYTKTSREASLLKADSNIMSDFLQEIIACDFFHVSRRFFKGANDRDLSCYFNTPLFIALGLITIKEVNRGTYGGASYQRVSALPQLTLRGRKMLKLNERYLNWVKGKSISGIKERAETELEGKGLQPETIDDLHDIFEHPQRYTDNNDDLIDVAGFAIGIPALEQQAFMVLKQNRLFDPILAYVVDKLKEQDPSEEFSGLVQEVANEPVYGACPVEMVTAFAEHLARRPEYTSQLFGLLQNAPNKNLMLKHLMRKFGDGVVLEPALLGEVFANLDAYSACDQDLCASLLNSPALKAYGLDILTKFHPSRSRADFVSLCERINELNDNTDPAVQELLQSLFHEVLNYAPQYALIDRDAVVQVAKNASSLANFERFLPCLPNYSPKNYRFLSPKEREILDIAASAMSNAATRDLYKKAVDVLVKLKEFSLVAHQWSGKYNGYYYETDYTWKIKTLFYNSRNNDAAAEQSEHANAEQNEHAKVVINSILCQYNLYNSDKAGIVVAEFMPQLRAADMTEDKAKLLVEAIDYKALRIARQESTDHQALTRAREESIARMAEEEKRTRLLEEELQKVKAKHAAQIAVLTTVLEEASATREEVPTHKTVSPAPLKQLAIAAICAKNQRMAG
jgi:hypothetical protein